MLVLREPGEARRRAVAAEAGVTKGVLHRHFADFDAFLVDLVQERIARIDDQAAALREAAGSDNLTGALMDLFDPVAVAIVGLVIFRDELRVRLRQARPGRGITVLAEAATMISSYLDNECELGRIAVDTDADALALPLIGAGHLLFAEREGGPPDAGAVGKVVIAVIADVVQRRLL
ncbi:TetR/AcrR family transcriptional regulator [Planomonospora algeriensis]